MTSKASSISYNIEIWDENKIKVNNFLGEILAYITHTFLIQE